MFEFDVDSFQSPDLLPNWATTWKNARERSLGIYRSIISPGTHDAPQQGCLTTPCFYLSPTLQGCSHDPSFARPIRSYCHRISASTDSYRGGSVMGTLLRLLGKMSFPFRRTIRRKAVLCLHLLRSMRKMPEGNAVPREQSEGVTRGWIRWCF